MNKCHEVENIRFDNETLSMTIDGTERAFKLKDISQRLLNASENQRLNFFVSPSGYGIHWPLIDEDLSIDALLGIAHNPEFNRAA